MIFTAKRILSTANRKIGNAKDASNVMDPFFREVIKDALFDDLKKERSK